MREQPHHGRQRNLHGPRRGSVGWVFCGTAAWFLCASAVVIAPLQAKISDFIPLLGSKSRPESQANDFFKEAFEKTKALYVDSISEDKLYEHAVNGMLNSLDPHSAYLNAEEFKAINEQVKGEFGGLGIEVTLEHGVVKVISPIDDTPAYEAGIKAGDYIVWIDDEPVLGMTIQEATDKMRGPKGTNVKLRIAREGQDPFDLTIKRDIIKIRPVKHRAESNIGYIRISAFNDQTEARLKEAVADLHKKATPKLEGLVLDLRNNPGGVLDQAVAVADLFLDSGEIVSVRGRDPQNIERRNATPGDIVAGIPIAVLINAGSASAAEIVAGALHDQKRAIVLGNRSFGKGSVQLVAPLKNDRGALKITVARYFPPSGQPIQGNGITPDIVINQAKVEPIDDKRRREENYRGVIGATSKTPSDRKESDVQNIHAVEPQKKPQDSTETDKHETEKDSKPSDNKVLNEGSQPAKVAESESDYQLARAIDLLKAYAMFQGYARDIRPTVDSIVLKQKK